MSLRNAALPLTTPEGERSRELIASGRARFVPNYKPRDMILDHGRGSRVWDLDSNDYIDFAAGIAVSSLGHQDPDLLAALDHQSRKLWHTSNVFFTEPAIHLAEALVEKAAFARRAYFCNSGTEANEAAIKLVRKWAADQGRGPEAREIITFNGSFHGRTLAAVTATAQPKYHAGFEPLPGGFAYCPTFGDIQALERMVSEKTAALMLEPIQGEGGVMPAPEGYLQAVRALCDARGILLVYDEVQCGIGRTGKLFGYELQGAEPDVMTLAKGLGGGLPIGAMLVGEKAENTLQFGSHGSTFGGNPVTCAVAMAALDKIDRPKFLSRVDEAGTRLREGLKRIGEKHDLFREIRGAGLMLGGELNDAQKGKANDLAEWARRYGVLALVAGPDVLRFLPPLTIADDEIDEGLSRLEQAFDHAMSA